MSFLNITDPSKRDQLVKDFLETKRNIQSNFFSDRLGDIEMKREFTKVFAPITESQQKATEATQKAISNVAQAIPKQLSIGQERSESSKGPSLAIEQLPQTLALATKGTKIGDTAFGLYSSSGKWFIGNKETIIDANNDIIIDGNTYKGTPGLRELITSKDPKNYTGDDLYSYKEILNISGALWTKNDPNTNKKKPGTGDKYYKIIEPIREAIMLQKRFSDPNISSNSLLKRYEVLKGSSEAGHTNVDSEMMAITDALYKRGVIDEEQYRTHKENLKINN